jgi:hypothetical protein
LRFAGISVGVAVLLAAVVATSSASTPWNARPVHVAQGNVEAFFNGGAHLEAPSKTRPTRASVVLSAKFMTRDGGHPPALRRFLLLVDKNADLDVHGIPVCRRSEIEGRFSREAEEACGAALVGSGTLSTEVRFPERRMAPIVGPRLLVFNGGVRRGVTTFFIHTYLEGPLPQALLTTVKVKRVRSGPYGISAIATIPRIARGRGSVTSLDLRLRRGITAVCAVGRLGAKATAVFSDGTRLEARLSHPCDQRARLQPPRFSFAVAPSVLPRSEPAPARISVAGSYWLEEGGPRFEALRSLRFEADRHLGLDLKGVPVCDGLERDVRRDLDEMEKVCGNAAIGHGRLTATGAFPGDRLISATGGMTLYNRGRVPGGARLLAFAYLKAPLTGAVEIPVEIRRINRGRMGWQIRLEIPRNTGGGVWITDYSLRIGKRFLSATCVGRKLALRAVSLLEDGTRRRERAVSPCTVAEADPRQQPVEPAR